MPGKKTIALPLLLLLILGAAPHRAAPAADAEEGRETLLIYLRGVPETGPGPETLRAAEALAGAMDRLARERNGPRWQLVRDWESGPETPRPQGREGLILVAGTDAVTWAAHLGASSIPAVFLDPVLLPEALPGSVGSTGSRRTDWLMPAPEFWLYRLQSFAEAAGAERLGYIPPPSASRDGAAGQAIDKAGATLSRQGGFSYFPYPDLTEASPAQCREAVDFLFFDEIDSIVLDHTPCFDPAREDYGELMELLKARGILPISLESRAQSGTGALLWSDGEDLERRGAMLAAEAGRAFPGLVMGDYSRPEELPPGWTDKRQIVFALDLRLAKAMGYAPRAWVLALSKIHE